MTGTAAGRTEGEALYERANDARRNGDHARYNAIIAELIAYNCRAAKPTGAA